MLHNYLHVESDERVRIPRGRFSNYGSRIRRTIAALCLCLASNNVWSVELSLGDAAPDFELYGSDGKVHRLSEYRGKVVVLAWFPKAFTSG